MSILATAMFFVAFSGCYTQFQTTRGEEGEDEYTEQKRDKESESEESEVEEYNDQDREYYYDDNSWYYRPRFGFSYYYPSYFWPSYAFSIAYWDPWYYDCYWWYDPWWCGTPYVRYPYYGYYWPSYYYPYYYPHRFYQRYASGSIRHGSRDFGSTRGSRGDRGTMDTRSDTYGTGRSGYDLPVGVARGDRSSGGVITGNHSVKAKESPRRVGSQRGYSTRGSSQKSGTRTERGVRGSGSRRSSSRIYVKPDPQPQVQPTEIHRPSVPPPATRSTDHSGSTRVEQPRSNGREVGSSRSSPPPPSSSGRAPSSSGGSRGGSTRGNRP
ncbi:MAG: hypothetical protein HY707_02770 [Ignavibacteriae bacterium]|nr:hypothetical protein [Ignavibacteriota bacterium]